MQRLAIVVQRYGLEINGGAELHARLLAERLALRHPVEVLTSCARDYADWAPVYATGTDVVNGVTVHRFGNPLRNDIGRARVPWLHKLRFKLRRLLALWPQPLVLRPRGDPASDGQHFLRRQGPHCAGLLAHLAASRDRYDVVIFFTALYEPSALGLQAWGGRSLLVPLLHDEKPMYLPVFHDVLRSAGALVFNTAAESRLAARLYGINTDDAAVAGVGMDVRRPDPGAVQEVLMRLRLTPGYLVYVGRIDVAKGCRELITAFMRHLRHDPQAQLVLVGQAVMTVPQHPRILCTGFVSEDDRNALIAGATALLIPSRYESLSMVLLEAMLLHTPVVANGLCEVLAEHVNLSGAGIAYRGRRQLLTALRTISALPGPERERLGALGAAYVLRQYAWPRVLSVFEDALAHVAALQALQPCRPALMPIKPD